MNRLFLACALLLVAPRASAGQALPFTHTVFDWEPKALDQQRRAYQMEASRNEVLFCVERYRVESRAQGERRIVIVSVRRAAEGGKHNMVEIEERCNSNQGPLPTIHTHSNGNCQFSPLDMASFAARRAPFEGVQCGDRHVIWTSSWQIVALGLGAEQLQEARSGFTPP